jgi:hypothetical protein
MRKRKQRGKLLVKNLKGLSASVLLVFLLVVSAAAWQFGEDCVLRGTVRYFGDSSISGLSVRAFIHDHEVASCETDGGYYELRIPPDDPGTVQVKEGWEEGDRIIVKVKNTRVHEFEASAGIHQQELVLSASDVGNLTTWGKIKALFR